MRLYQTPGRRPRPITGRFLNTVTREWAVAPNERAPFRFHGAVVGFVDRCLPRTRNLAASNKHLAEFSSNIFPRFLKSLIFFPRRFVLTVSGTEIFWRVSLKFYFFVETSPFHCHRSNHAFFHENHEMHFTASVCEKNNSTNNPIELEKGQILSVLTLTVFAMSESPKIHQITKIQISYRKRKDRLALRSTASFFVRNTEKRYPYVTTLGAQQQLSSSTAEAAAAAAAAVAAKAAAARQAFFFTAVAAAPWSTRRRGEAI